MSQSADPANPSKVVSLGERKPTGERVGQLLAGVCATTITHCKALVASVFEHVDDALFDLAEKAENNATQTQYFDGMREARKKRQWVERKFIDHLDNHFSQFGAGRPLKLQTAAGSGGDGELSLVDDSELEESLAIASMTSKAENRYARQLYAVNQRLSVICGGNEVTQLSNPLAPASLAQCFRRAMGELEADVKVKLIIYKLFERYALSALDPLYDAVNNELIRAGVLPRLHPTTRHRPAAAGRAGRGSDAAMTDAEALADDDFDRDADRERYSEELYDTVNALLASRRHRTTGRRTPSDAQRAALPALSVADLVAAISLLQQRAPPAPATLEQLDDDDTALSVQQLKRELHDQIHAIGRSGKARVSAADEDTIDVVGMLFEYIVQDPNLPPQMQALLGRLQIPFLKIAILDKQAFAQPSHAARQLLNAMAEAAKGWSKESDRDLRLLNEVKNVVETLLHGFEDDTAIFERLLDHFQQFVASTHQRAEVAEQRAAESARGRERLQAARRIAAREVFTRIHNHEVPDLVRNVLTRPWANYLVLTALRQGDDSREWHAAVRFIDDMVWSTEPLTNDADRLRLRNLLPQMERVLRHGLTTVAFHEGDIKRLMQALGRLYRAQLGEPEPEPAPGSAAVDNEPETGAVPFIPDAVEPIAPPSVEVDNLVDDGEPLPDDAPAMQQVAALRVGNWVEFVREDQAKDRAKLSWISPISNKYLFVNRRGLKVCDMTMQHLARSIDAGHTVVLTEVPLFDRALDAIVERLKQGQSGTTAANNAAPPSASAGKGEQSPVDGGAHAAVAASGQPNPEHDDTPPSDSPA